MRDSAPLPTPHSCVLHVVFGPYASSLALRVIFGSYMPSLGPTHCGWGLTCHLSAGFQARAMASFVLVTYLHSSSNPRRWVRLAAVGFVLLWLFVVLPLLLQWPQSWSLRLDVATRCRWALGVVDGW